MRALTGNSEPSATTRAPFAKSGHRRDSPGARRLRSALAALTTCSVLLSALPVSASVALQDDGPSATDIAKAKGLYLQAEDLVAEGKDAEAIPFYEEAYRLVPGKHGFAFKVGVAAHKTGDCAKAKEYFDHLITYGSDQQKLAGKIKEAKKILAKIKKSKCDQPKKEKAAAKPKPAVSESVGLEEENPFATNAETKQKAAARDAVEESRAHRDRTNRSVQNMKSYGLMGVGAGLAVAGGVFLVLARRNGKQLGELAAPSETLEFFPEGDFACRNPEAECPYRVSLNMKRFNWLGYSLIALGVLSVGSGTYFWLQQRKNGNSKAGKEPKKAVARLRVAPHWSPRGMGASARLKF